MLSKIQRFLTKSDYDHIGIVVKFPQSRRFILESSGKYGVSLTDFDKFCSFISAKMSPEENKLKKKDGSVSFQTGMAYRKFKKNSSHFSEK